MTDHHSRPLLIRFADRRMGDSKYLLPVIHKFFALAHFKFFHVSPCLSGLTFRNIDCQTAKRGLFIDRLHVMACLTHSRNHLV